MAWRRSGGLSPSFSPASLLIQQGDEVVDDNEEEEATLAISDQRTLYLVNIFIGNTVRFLNSFSSICEDKLSQLHRRMLHLDATLTLLEAKIRSTCHIKDIGDNSHAEADGSSSHSLPEKSILNYTSLDRQSVSGESSSKKSAA